MTDDHMPKRRPTAGRPPIDDENPATRNLTVRLPEPLRAEVDARAQRDGISIGLLVRRALEAYLRKGA